MQPSLLEQGMELMLYGMGTVFVFLASLVLVTGLMSFLVQRFGRVPEQAVAPLTATPDEDKKQVAAIAAAIHQYRARHNK